jgi:hypothetical protein
VDLTAKSHIFVNVSSVRILQTIRGLLKTSCVGFWYELMQKYCLFNVVGTRSD